MLEKIGRSGEILGEGMNRVLPDGVCYLYKYLEVIGHKKLLHIGICYFSPDTEGRQKGGGRRGGAAWRRLHGHAPTLPCEFFDTKHTRGNLWMMHVVDFLHFVLVSSMYHNSK